jgi:hypothetical protein
VTEAGFLEVPAQATAATYRARMFYAFHPADEDAAHKPLAVLFNGGPGYATSLGLHAYGTAPWTLDESGRTSKNPASWTRFANLLYLDERMAGFSYGLGPGTTRFSSCEVSETEDADDFVRAMLDFLDAHRPLMAAPVVLVGESYGGVRATRMLELLLRSDDARVKEHYARAGTDASQFGAQVLVQPLVLGAMQYTEQFTLIPDDPYIGHGVDMSKIDPYDATKPAGWSDALDGHALAAMSNVDTASSLLGVPLASIPDLLPGARDGAFRNAPPTPSPDLDRANAALTSALGALGPNDAYLVQPGDQCITPPDLPHSTVSDTFVRNLRPVRTFITNARSDLIIYTPAIPAVFAHGGWGGAIDTSPRDGVARPGCFTVTPPDGDGPIEVRFPPYVASGHMVAVTQPADLADDVEAWLARR